MERTDDGILIAFEGIDGAGKTTQVGMLAAFLRHLGETVVCSKEPTDGPWGRKIKESATSGRMSLAEEIHAFTEDRKEHVRNLIVPALTQKHIVILDRYFYSTIAYQGSVGVDVDELDTSMRQIAPEPDKVFLLDVSPAVGLARIKESRGETPNAFESIENLTAVRSVFQLLAKQHSNIHVLDGMLGVDSVHRSIILETQKLLKDRHVSTRR